MSHTPNDKPLGRSLGWQRLGTERPYRSPWHNLRQDAVRLPDGQEITYTYQEHPGFVTVVPVTDDGHVIMLRCYRYAVDDWCWELPAGGQGDKPGASPEEVARQELAEETGGDCVEMRKIGWFYAMNGTSDARCTFFLATGVALNGPPQLEATEHSEVHRVPIAQALQMARDGRITDGDSALALLRCEPQLLNATRTTQLVAHDPAWASQFREEAARLAQVFSDQLLDIHHIGSTAIPGIQAKPIVDMLPVVRDIEAVDDLNDAMVALGYVPKGENGIPGRRYFSRDVDGVRRFHVHVFEAGNPEIDRHVTFVEYLKAHPAAARQYEHVKLELSRRYPTDIVRYTDGKSQVIRELDRQAARWKPGPASVAGRP